MDYRTLGNSGLKVSVTGLGCNNFGMRLDKERTAAVVDACFDEGINLFDTADVYGGTRSETFLGELLGARRHEIVLATKFAMPTGPGTGGASRAYIFKAVEASLTRLQTDYIDLYQVHRFDPETPQYETLEALNDLVRQGKVRYIGSSNYSGWQIADAHWTATSRNLNPFVSAQNNYSLLDRRIEREVLPACEHFGVGMLPYFPLASGLLTGKYRRGEGAPEGTRLASGERGERALAGADFDMIEALDNYARERGHTLVTLAMSWLACQQTVPSVIAGATSPEQVAQNAQATAWQMSAEEVADIAGITPALMCGRFNITSDPLAQALLDITSTPVAIPDQYNVAPTDPVPVLRRRRSEEARGEYTVETMRWWLTPYWSPGPSQKYAMFNARSESLEKSRAFREPFKKRRCVLPASGYYEWQKMGSSRIPFYFHPEAASDALWFAGLWDFWRGEVDGEETSIVSCTIVTTAAHESIEFLHNRQPVMLDAAGREAWLDLEAAATDLKALCEPRLPVAALVTPVTTYVNNARNKDERCVEPVGDSRLVQAA